MTWEQNRLYQYLIAVAEDEDNEDCLRRHKKKFVGNRKDSEFMEYSIVEAHLRRISDRKNDRSVPVETTVLNEYNLKTDNNLESATIRYGAYSDDLTRAYHAAALTIGATIYFSTKAYKPETEEGRKTIAHELTHVAQHKNRTLADNRTKDELEAEAEEAEKTEQPPTEPIVVIQAGRRQYRMRRSEAARLDAYTEREVEDWIEREKDMMPDKEYARLLKAYRRYLDGREQGRRPWTEER